MATFRNTATGGENAIEGVASSGRGIVGFSTGNYGVSGDSQKFAGVRGTSNFSRGVEGWSRQSEGVFGITASDLTSAGGVAGVWGLCGNDNKPGVAGTVSSDFAPGVAGANNFKGPGVAGASDAGPGVMGESRDAFGVVGQSKGFGNGDGRGRGGVDGSTFHGGAGVRGSSYGAESKDGVGVEAYSAGGTALVAFGQTAAHLAGDVFVYGNLHANDVVADLVASNIVAHRLTVTGLKSAAVPHPDGMHRRLYCMESPECWFEDFGEASLKNGVATVKLDREFAALVKTGRYHVFLSSYDAVQLYVSKRSREGFEIRALPDARGKVRQRARCAYRIVARRKDVKAPRLAKVKIPARRKRPPFPKLLKSPVRLSKRTHNQLAGLRKAHRKRLREVKRFFSATARDIFKAPAKPARRLASSASR
jgi:hypothetical protein